jgi:hypothetical protein
LGLGLGESRKSKLEKLGGDLEVHVVKLLLGYRVFIYAMQAILTKSPYSLIYLPSPLASFAVLEVSDRLPINSTASFERLSRYVKTISYPHPVQSVQCNAYQEQPRTYEHHNLTSPSAPLDTNHGFSECHLISSTPKPSCTR